MSKDTPIGDGVDEYLKGVQDRQGLRNTAAGVDLNDELPPAVGEPVAAGEQASGLPAKVYAPEGTQPYEMLDFLAEHASEPVQVEVTEVLGRHTEATVKGS